LDVQAPDQEGMRPRHAVSIALAAVALAPAQASAAPCVGADLAPTASNLATVEQATLCLLNEQRAAAGLPAVSRNGQLDAASRAHSQDMVSRHYFAHDTPEGGGFLDRVTTAGYITDSLFSWDAGENIAWGAGPLAPASKIMVAWMTSQHHRENILDPDFKEIGVGVVMGVPTSGAGASGATYTTDFGARVMSTSDSGPATTAAKKAKKKAKSKKAKRCSRTAKRRATRASRSKKAKKTSRCSARRSAKKARSHRS
jgi:uncharacterized protein YkwD